MKSTSLRSLWMIAFTTITVLLTACSKTGPTGPAGATGAQGAQGTQGAAGGQGTKGDAGTANVIYSAWTSLTFTGSGSSYSATWAVAKITQDIIDKGVVLVYYQEGTLIVPLPYTNSSVNLDDYFEVGKVHIISTFDGSGAGYRYVIIPGAVAGFAASHTSVQPLTSEQLKKMTYKEVCAKYNIPE